MAATSPAIKVGDIITANPWMRGYESVTSEEGIVLGLHLDGSEYVIAWFAGLGPLSNEEIGRAVQPIMISKPAVTGNVISKPVSERKRLARELLASQLSDAAPLYRALLASLPAGTR